MNNEDVQKEIDALEAQMLESDFWNDKHRAQDILREISELKNRRDGLGKYDKGNAILSIVSGAGGDDAEDFSSVLFAMYEKYAKKKGWAVSLIHSHKTEHGGYRNITVEISGKGHMET